MKKGTIIAFIPSKYGNKVLLNNNKLVFLHSNVAVEPGMEIIYFEHKEGEECTLLNGTKITFKKPGIHDVMVTVSAKQANIAFKHSLVKELEELGA